MPDTEELPEPFDYITCLNGSATYPNDPIEEVAVYTADQLREAVRLAVEREREKGLPEMDPVPAMPLDQFSAGELAVSVRACENYARLYGERVREAERERCAKIAETPVSGEQDDITMAAKDRIAAAIRKP